MRRETRERILDAANALFYAEGVRAVSVDEVAARAGITKKTLYYHFRSKDDLIAAYLESRDQPNLVTFKRWFDGAGGNLSDRVAAIFEKLAKAVRRPTWKGCGFIRTVAELANMPGHPAIAVGASHKKAFEAWMAARIGSAKPEMNENDCALLARQIAVLLDGLFATLLMHRDPTYALAAADAARELVNAAEKRSL